MHCTWGKAVGGDQHLLLFPHPPGDVHHAYSVWTSVFLRLDQHPTGVHTGKDDTGEAVSEGNRWLGGSRKHTSLEISAWELGLDLEDSS